MLIWYEIHFMLVSLKNMQFFLKKYALENALNFRIHIKKMQYEWHICSFATTETSYTYLHT